jgi:tetratricopeptide (TPR) repeat protein
VIDAGSYGAIETELDELVVKVDQHRHAFELLGLSLETSERDIDRRSTTLMRRYRIDRIRAADPDAVDRAQRVLDAIEKARAFLLDPERRHELARLVRAGDQRPGLDAIVDGGVESRKLARMGDKLLAAGRIDRALESFQKAAEVGGDAPELGAAIAWCEYLRSEKTLEDAKIARRALGGLVKDHPECGTILYYVGLLYADLGNERRAYRSFVAASEADPNLMDARRRARILRSETSGRKG